MNRRSLIFIGSFALTYLLMVVFLTYQYPDQGDLFASLTFGVALISAAVLGVLKSKQANKRKGLIQVLKIIFASYALVLVLWIVGSLLLLPIFGHIGFEAIGEPMFIYAVLGLMLLVSPFIAKNLE